MGSRALRLTQTTGVPGHYPYIVTHGLPVFTEVSAQESMDRVTARCCVGRTAYFAEASSAHGSPRMDIVFHPCCCCSDKCYTCRPRRY